jgi:aryl-alcohol dehydrogenase-like predicted oxidoreductase
LSVLDDLVREGKVRYIGSSQMAPWQIVEADHVARVNNLARFVSAQNRYNLLERNLEKDLVPVCVRYGIGILPYYPLLHGVLAGRFRRNAPRTGSNAHTDITDATFDVVEALESFAAERGVGLLDVAIGGLAAQPGLGSVIAGASRPEQVSANARAADWRPGPDDLDALDQILPRG